MAYELAIVNPRRLKRKRKASAAQIAARKRFIAKFAKGRKKRFVKRRKASAAKSHHSGVSAMAKRRKRRAPARTAKGRFVKKSHRKSTARRHKRRRSRPSGSRPAMGYVVGSRKVRRLKLNPRARRRRYRRNPLGLGSVSGIVKGQLMPALYGAGGAVALNLALSYLPLPDSLKTGWTRHGVRLVGALGIGILAKKFVKGQAGSAMAAGALTVVMYDIVKAALAQFAPEIGGRLGEFEDVSLSGDYYDPAQYVGTGAYLASPGDGQVDGYMDGVGAYMEGNLDGVGAYMENDI